MKIQERRIPQSESEAVLACVQCFAIRIGEYAFAVHGVHPQKVTKTWSVDVVSLRRASGFVLVAKYFSKRIQVAPGNPFGV